jgi:hypothetical protein
VFHAESLIIYQLCLEISTFYVKDSKRKGGRKSGMTAGKNDMGGASKAHIPVIPVSGIIGNHLEKPAVAITLFDTPPGRG